MSGPASVEPVLARISQLQAQLGLTSDVASVGVVGVDRATTSFASTLVGASATSAAVPSSWTIPWAEGAAPAAVPAATKASTGQAAGHTLSASGTTRRPVATGSTATGSDVVWPLRGTISQRFGPTTCTLEPSATVNGHHYAHYHDGLDIAAAKGTNVRSMAAGKVEFAGRYPDGAEVVRVRNTDGSVALYAHMEPGLDVKAGDKVSAGEVIGRVGMTGNTNGPHLHLELTVNGKNIDPLPSLRSGRLPGVAQSASTWKAASPLAANAAKVSQAALDRFDAVAAQIPYHAQIRDAAVRAGIDPLFLASLVKAESGFHAGAVSSAGAEGLCQLMPATAKAMGVTNPFDPVQNLRAGARYIAHNLSLYGRSDLALAAYHDGKGTVAAAGGVPDHAITHGYIDRILSYWTHYREAAA